MTRPQMFLTPIAALALASTIAAPGRAGTIVQLIDNGGFETGDFTGWTVASQVGSTDYLGNPGVEAGFFAQGDSLVTPVSGLGALGPQAGDFYALADSTGPSSKALIQGFTVPQAAISVLLSFDMYNFDFFGAGPVGDDLDFRTVPNQHVQVDILPAGAGAFDSGVVANLFTGAIPNPDPLGPPPEWMPFAFDLTGVLLPGETYQLRFGAVENQFVLSMGIDNVSLMATVPEPSSWALLAPALVMVLAARRIGRGRT